MMKFESLKTTFSNLKIRTKLIILFILIKIIPVVLIAAIALYGVESLYQFFKSNTFQIRETTKEVVTTTAKKAIADSIISLDRKSQQSLEVLSARIAESTADFLYACDSDIRLLSKLPQNTSVYQEFLTSKMRDVLVDESVHYVYDDNSSSWIKEGISAKEVTMRKAQLQDNAREFHRIDPIKKAYISLPIYKELSYFDVDCQ